MPTAPHSNSSSTSLHAATHVGSAVPGGGQSTGRGSAKAESGSIVQEVFLTPRVLDAGTFTAFSTTLKELLADADDRRVSLTALSSEVATLRDALRALTTELEGKLQTAVKVLPAIDQRLAKVNDALTFAEAVVRANAEKLPHRTTVAPTVDSPQTRTEQPSVVSSPAPTARDPDPGVSEAIEERLGLVANDLRGALETSARSHAEALDEQAELVRAQLTEHAHDLEADSRSRLEGLLTAMVTQAVEEQVKLAQQKMEAEIAGRMQAEVDAAIERTLAGQIHLQMQPHMLAFEEFKNTRPVMNGPDPTVMPTLNHLRQQMDDMTRWARSVDTLLNDHSGLVAAQSAHSALAQLATQVAGLGQHLEAMTRRAEMTAHTLAGLMAQLPPGVVPAMGGIGGMASPTGYVPRETQR